jgi:predicted MFS family arabinose efflux permease
LNLDLLGTVLVIVAVGLLVYPLIRGHELGWPAWAFVMLAASVVVFVIFVAWQRRKMSADGSPLVIPGLFRHRSFSIGLVISLLIFTMMSCYALTFTLLLQSGHSFSAIHTVLTALFITAGLVPTVGALSKKVIPALGKWSIVIGTVIMAAGSGAVALIVDQFNERVTTWHVAPGLFVLGIGMGLVFTPLLPFVLSNVDPQDAGSASGTANAVQQIGNALGVALIGLVFFSGLTSTVGYDKAFGRGIVLQLGLLALALVLALFLPKRIAPEAFQQSVL